MQAAPGIHFEVAHTCFRVALLPGLRFASCCRGRSLKRVDEFVRLRTLVRIEEEDERAEKIKAEREFLIEQVRAPSCTSGIPSVNCNCPYCLTAQLVKIASPP